MHHVNFQDLMDYLKRFVGYNERFQLNKVASFGIEIIQSMAFNQSCIALGSGNDVVVCTQTGQVTLSQSPLLTLAFHYNCLVGIDADGKLVIWNLSTKSSIVVNCHEPVTCFGLLSNWILVGLFNGLTRLVDLDGTLSEYSIQPIAPMGQKDDSIVPLPVVCICPHPTDSNRVLIGYSSGSIHLFDLAQCRPIRKYHYKDKYLAAMAWNPNGNHFVASYSDGLLVFWETQQSLMSSFTKKDDKKTPLFVRTVSGSKQDDVALIHSISWIPFETGSRIIVQGGQPVSIETSIVSIIPVSDQDYKNPPLLSLAIPKSVTRVSYWVFEGGSVLVWIDLLSGLGLGVHYLDSTEKIGLAPCLDMYRNVFGKCIANASDFLTLELQSVVYDSIRFITDSTDGTLGSLKRLPEFYSLLKQCESGSQVEIWQATVTVPRHLVSFPCDVGKTARVLLDLENKSLIVLDQCVAHVWTFLTSIDLKFEERKPLIVYQSSRGAPVDDPVHVEEEDKNVDDIMAQLDATLDQVMEESKSINRMLNDTEPVSDDHVTVPFVDSSSWKVLASINPNDKSISVGWHSYGIVTFKMNLERVLFSNSWNVMVAHTFDTISLIDTLFQTELHTYSSQECFKQKDDFSNVGYGMRFLSFDDSPSDLKPCVWVGSALGRVSWISLDSTRSVALTDPLSMKFRTGIQKVYTLDSECRLLNMDNQMRSKTKDEIHVLVLSSTGVAIYRDSVKGLKEIAVKDVSNAGNETILSSCVILKDGSFLVLVTSLGFALVYSLPNCDLQFRDPLSNSVDLSRLHECHISKEGRISFYDQKGLWITLWIFSELPEVPETRLYDIYHASKQAKAHRTSLKTVGTMAMVLNSRNKEHDALCILVLTLVVSKPTGPADQTQGDNAFGHAKNALDERGQKLEQMEEKFSKLSDASKSFADTVKQYNQAQALKKWWQI